MTDFQDRVKAVLVSTALGDALGAPIEKLSYQEIKEHYGRVESLNTKWYKDDLTFAENLGKKRGNGIVTDDTLMTLALCNVYQTEKRHLDAYDMANEFVKEIAFKKVYIPEFDRETMLIERLFYPEKHIFLRHALANCDPREGGYGNMINCGAAMYIAPIGIVNAGNPRGAYNEAILFAMAHQASYGLEAAGVLAACVSKAFAGNVTIDEIINVALYYAKDGTRDAIKEITDLAKDLKERKACIDEVVEVFHTCLKKFSPMGNDVHRNVNKLGISSNHYTPSRVWSIEELPIALGFIVYNDGAYYKSIYDGINSGRDTDSIGVMIGVILGAMHGSSVINDKDIKTLEKANRLDFNQLAIDFTEVATDIITDDINNMERIKAVLS